MVEVAISEGAPVLRGEFSKGGVGLKSLRFAARGKFVDGRAESGAAFVDVAVVGDDLFGGGGGAFWPGKRVDDELLQGPEAKGSIFMFHVELADGGKDGESAVTEHLRDRHFAPKRALIGLE